MKSIEDSLPSCMEDLQVSNEEDGSISLLSFFSFPQSFSGFQGHFTGNPVLPAIVQLSAVRYMVEKAFGKKLVPHTITRTKFRSMVLPNQRIEIHLSIRSKDNLYHGKFRLSRTSKASKASKDMIANGHCIFSETEN